MTTYFFMNERIQFVEHKDKKILLVDFSHSTPEQMLTLLEEFRDKITYQPPDSLLILADFTDAKFDKSVITRMKELLVLDRPFVKHAAWVGTKSLPRVYYDNLKSFSQRDLPAFGTREEALDWLVKE
ncbi:MAG: hypothetical protein ACRD2S_01595 [Terriglobales bacterium]